MGKFFYYCLPYRRPIVLQNIKLVFGDSLKMEEQIKLAQCFYSHLVKFIKENITLGFLSDEQLKSRVEVRGKPYLLDALSKNKGVMILGGHFGNWEMTPMGAALKLYQEGLTQRFYCIRKILSNKYIEKIAFNRFNRAGIRVIPKQKSLRQTVKALAKGNMVVFVLDQHSKVGTEGVVVNFFNKPASTFRSLSKLAKAITAPVLPVSYFRLPSGRHVLEFHPEITWISDPDPEKEQILNTEKYNHFIEQTILAHPEQWIWMHKRWKVMTSKASHHPGQGMAGA